MKLMDNCELSTIIFNDRDNRDPNRAQKRSHKEEQKKEIPTHNPEPRYPHREKKRPEEEREAALFVLKKDIWISQWEPDLGLFPVFQLDPTMQLLARGAMSQLQIGAQSLCPCALLSARPHSLPPHPAKLA